jgi:gluconolactonase
MHYRLLCFSVFRSFIALLLLFGATSLAKADDYSSIPRRVRIVATYDKPLAHEGPVFLPERHSLFFTSNRLHRPDGSQYVVVSLFDVYSGQTTDLRLSHLIPMANGAFRLKNGSIVLTMQGDLKHPAGLASFDLNRNTVTFLTKGYAQYQFNSPNDVVQANDLSLWFTDPQYGYEQGFRPKPTMGNWVWWLDGAGRSQRLLIDGFAKPNGIAFSRDQRYVYVTDSGNISGNGVRNSDLPRTIYRFRLINTPDGPLATDRTTFAVVTKGIPDGLKVDGQDRVWTATGAGLEVFSPGGMPLAVIPIDGGISNFALTNDGGAYLMGETKIYRLDPW